MAYNYSIGSRLGKRILTIADTHKDVAVVLNICRQAANKKLRGVRGFTIPELHKLSRAYSVPVWWFFAPARLDPAEARELDDVMISMGELDMPVKRQR